MIEDFIDELNRPCKALKLLLVFLQDYMNDDIVSYIEAKEAEKRENIFAIIHAIDLVCTDIERLKKEYYNLMIQEKYS